MLFEHSKKKGVYVNQFTFFMVASYLKDTEKFFT